MSLNQSLNVSRNLTISSSASGQQWAIGPRRRLRLFMIFPNALSLLKVSLKVVQLFRTISPIHRTSCNRSFQSNGS